MKRFVVPMVVAAATVAYTKRKRAASWRRLRLNRPPLVALRRARRETESLHRDLITAQEEQARLRERIGMLERELESVLEQILRLSGQ